MAEDATIDEGVSVAEAAKILNISKNAVRKRVQRKSIPATKVDGEWRILIDQMDVEVEDDAPQGHDTASTHDVALDVARQNLETFRDAFVMPLVERIGELEHDNGRLEAENEFLRRRIEELESEPDVEDESEHTPGASPWWRRWLGIS